MTRPRPLAVPRRALLAVAISLPLLAACGHLSGGPLNGQVARVAYIEPAKKNAVFTDAAVVLDLRGNRPARILKVESLGGGDTLTYLGAKIVGPHRGYSAYFATIDEWPPVHFKAASVITVEGTRIEPTTKTWHTQGYAYCCSATESKLPAMQSAQESE